MGKGIDKCSEGDLKVTFTEKSIDLKVNPRKDLEKEKSTIRQERNI